MLSDVSNIVCRPQLPQSSQLVTSDPNPDVYTRSHVSYPEPHELKVTLPDCEMQNGYTASPARLYRLPTWCAAPEVLPMTVWPQSRGGDGAQQRTTTSSMAASPAQPEPRKYSNRKESEERAALASCQASPWLPLSVHRLEPAPSIKLRVPMSPPCMWYWKLTAETTIPAEVHTLPSYTSVKRSSGARA